MSFLLEVVVATVVFFVVIVVHDNNKNEIKPRKTFPMELPMNSNFHCQRSHGGLNLSPLILY